MSEMELPVPGETIQQRNERMRRNLTLPQVHHKDCYCADCRPPEEVAAHADSADSDRP